MNTLGKNFVFTSFGESHGEAIGGVLDGVPAGVRIDMDMIREALDKRAGRVKVKGERLEAKGTVSPRALREGDEVEWLSGVLDGVTLGTPIAFIIRNKDARPEDYEWLKHSYRIGHADRTYQEKYGIRDHRGGGRTSARITLSRCVAGALAKLVLRKYGISVTAYTMQVGGITIGSDYKSHDLTLIESNAVRCPDAEKAAEMERLIKEVKAEGDTIGGVIQCVVSGCPVGLGSPEFDKLHAVLGKAMLSINAVKGFEYGEGFSGVTQKGSQQNDLFFTDEDGDVHTCSNHSGGIQGGLSNGEDIVFRVAFKPVATLLREQPTIDKHGNATTLCARGRHDPCVLPRAVPIVEAMAAMVSLDEILTGRAACL